MDYGLWIMDVIAIMAEGPASNVGSSDDPGFALTCLAAQSPYQVTGSVRNQ